MLQLLVFLFHFICLCFSHESSFDNEHWASGGRLSDESRYYVNNMPDYTPGANLSFPDEVITKLSNMRNWYSSIFHEKTFPPGKIKFGEGQEWDCYGGSCGAAIMYYKMALKSPSNYSSYMGLALKYIIYAINKRVEGVIYQNGFLRSTNGVYAMAALIYHKSNPTLALKYISYLKLSIDEVSKAERSKYHDELDFGRAGLIMASLLITESGNWNSDIINRSKILKIAHDMFNNGVEQSKTRGVLAWNTITTSFQQYGQNHGSTGILMQFFRLPELFDNTTISTHIRATIDYFLTIQFPSGNFPTPLHPPYPNVPDILIQWCHGSPAFVPVLGEAYLRFKDERYYKSMERAVDNIWEKGLLRKGLMVCHGISGNTYMLFYAYKIKFEPKFLYRALKFQEFVISHPEISEPGKMVQNYPYVFFGSSYMGGIVLWSDLLVPNILNEKYAGVHFPGFAIKM